MIKLDYSKESNALFDSFFHKVFKTGQIEFIKWNQYTPYFEFKKNSKDSHFSSNIDLTEIVLSKSQNPLIKSKIIKFLTKFGNDFYLKKYGDHAEITLTKEGFNVSDYEHI